MNVVPTEQQGQLGLAGTTLSNQGKVRQRVGAEPYTCTCCMCVSSSLHRVVGVSGGRPVCTVSCSQAGIWLQMSQYVCSGTDPGHDVSQHRSETPCGVT